MKAQLLKRDNEWVLVTRAYATRPDGTAVGQPIETVHTLHPNWIDFYDRNSDLEGSTLEVDVVQMWKNSCFGWSTQIPADQLENTVTSKSFAKPTNTQYDKAKGRAIIQDALDALDRKQPDGVKAIAWEAWKASARRTAGWANDTDQDFERNERPEFEEFYSTLG